MNLASTGGWLVSACFRNVTAPPRPVPWASVSKLAVDIHAGPVFAQAEVAWLWGSPCHPLGAVCTPGCHKSLWQCGFTPGHGHCLRLLWVLVFCGGGALPEVGSAPLGFSALRSPSIYPGTLGRRLEPTDLLSCCCHQQPGRGHPHP